MGKLKKIRTFFEKVNFYEENHKYEVEKQILKKSVSNLIKYFVTSVDFDKISYIIDKRKGLIKGTTKKEWKSISDKSCTLGTKTHLFGEEYIFNNDIKPNTGFEKAIVKFWDTLPEHIIPVFSELVMYHKEYKYGGTADVILYNKKTDKFIICDYKTNKELHKNYKGKKLLKPFDNLLETNFNKYQIQLSFYKLLFEQTGYEVEETILIWLKEDGEMIMYNTEDFTDKIKEVC